MAPRVVADAVPLLSWWSERRWGYLARGKKKKRHMKDPSTSSPDVHFSVLIFYCFQIVLVTMAGSADAQVGKVGSQAACAVGRAEGGEGHSVLGVQRGGQWRRELDVGQIRK